MTEKKDEIIRQLKKEIESLKIRNVWLQEEIAALKENTSHPEDLVRKPEPDWFEFSGDDGISVS